MIQPTLLFGATLTFLCAAIYYYVGRVLSQRRSASPESRMAWRFFIAWWYALATANILTGVMSILGAIGMVNLPLFITFSLTNLLATCVALYGLVFYLLYLFTGNRKLLLPLSLFYVAYYMLLTYYVLASNPTSVVVERWRTTLHYSNQLQGPLFSAILFLLLVPPIIGGLVYFMLYFRVENVTQKYRILLVSWSIIIWFLSVTIASLSGVSRLDAWQVVSRLIGFGAAFTTLMAYQPPSWVKQRFQVNSIAEERS